MDPDNKRPQRRGPTREELEQAAARLPPDRAAKLLARARPAPQAPEPESEPPTAEPPKFVSWEDFLARTTATERMEWCRGKAKKANQPRLMSVPVDVRITAAEVWAILEAANGRCEHCGSLAVEKRPSSPSGQPLSWAQVGRRIGSLGHRVTRFSGGSNDPRNLCWSCLWCNTWPDERRVGATDHGGLQPEGDLSGIEPPA